jgi:hypothetical protein
MKHKRITLLKNEVFICRKYSSNLKIYTILIHWFYLGKLKLLLPRKDVSHNMYVYKKLHAILYCHSEIYCISSI